MSYTVDKVAKLQEAIKLGRFGSVASLRAQGVTARQHNVDVTTEDEKKTAKKAEKKSSAKSADKKS